ncbi:MAG: DUF503 domain-containing protein [Candidatus Acidiferrales bacterium]|mgnify:CR=1 FL=1|jgi:hypothetical protein|nr:DUF503 domain-containing protein [Acidobacteriota bacterium]MCH7987119.1 DUF503 domain-containing protein [Acidobacteriota bacterium]MCH8946957.1 DUF503 domain-containing protein [Acidobacteriota bacterium]
MVVGLVRLEIHLPYAQSLKDKRQVVRKLKERLRARFNVAVAELDHQELWQRATVGVVSISNDNSHLAQVLETVVHESEKILKGDLVDSQIEYL